MISKEMGEILSHLCLFGIGLVLSVASVRLGTGVPTEPGPGFLPLGTGLLLSIASIFGLRKFIRGRRKQEWGAFGAPANRKILGIIGSLVAYAFVLPRLGYLLSTFLLMVFLFSLVEKRKWIGILVKATLVTLTTYLTFEKWLACQLPQGILWF